MMRGAQPRKMPDSKALSYGAIDSDFSVDAAQEGNPYRRSTCRRRLTRDGIASVLDARSGNVIGLINAGLGPHNTIVGLSGRRVYLGGRNYPHLEVVSTATSAVIRRIGPPTPPGESDRPAPRTRHRAGPHAACRGGGCRLQTPSTRRRRPIGGDRDWLMMVLPAGLRPWRCEGLRVTFVRQLATATTGRI
jgi:hypothetical protein